MRMLTIAGTCLLLAAACTPWGGPHPLTAQPAPAFELGMLGGGDMNLASHKGAEVVVLDFWASWCPPCREGLPMVASVARSYADKPVAVYAVNLMEDDATVRSFLRESGLDVPVLMDHTGSIAEQYGVTGIPQTVVIGKDGVVAEVHVGLSGNFERKLRSKIDELLAR